MDALVNLSVTIHGLFRWVVAILAIVVLVKFAIGWLGKRPFTPADKQLGTAYAMAVTIQFVLGLINLIGYMIAGRFSPGAHMEHAVYGLIAVALAHMTAMFKNQPDDKRFRNAFFLVLLSLVVVLLSVIRLRAGWFNMAFAPF
jgi:Na+-translocating ferredoxin:NAD+ oxidoreductase RnfA subunit